jgi:WD40 repeat protein
MLSINKNKDKKQKKLSHKGGKVLGPVRHFRIAILDNKEIHRSEKGLGAAEATISMKANPVDAAKKLMSSICKHQGLKKMNRLKCNAIFWIRETTRNHSKIYGPYKGKFINLMKNGKEKIVKLKTGVVIKYSLKPVVKKYKEKINESLQKKVNKMMKGGTVLIYDPFPLFTINTNDNYLSCIAIIQEKNKIVSNEIVSCNATKNIKIWDSIEKIPPIGPKIFKSDQNSVVSLAISSNGSKILSSNRATLFNTDYSIKILDSNTGNCVKSLIGHTATVLSIAVNDEGNRIISGGEDGTIKKWALFSGKCLNTLKGHKMNVMSVVFFNEFIVSGSMDKTIKIWYDDIVLPNVNGYCISTLRGHTEGVMSVVISNDNKIVSGSIDGTIKIWNFGSEECLNTLKGHKDSVNSLVILNDNKIVSGSSDNTLKIWDSLSGTCLQTLTGHKGPIKSIALIKDNNKIISCSNDTTIKIWNLKKQENLNIVKPVKPQEVIRNEDYALEPKKSEHKESEYKELEHRESEYRESEHKKLENKIITKNNQKIRDIKKNPPKVLVINYNENGDYASEHKDFANKIISKINEKIDIPYDFIFLCTQKSLSSTKDHMQHVIGDELKKENSKYELFSKIDATRPENSGFYRLSKDSKFKNVRIRCWKLKSIDTPEQIIKNNLIKDSYRCNKKSFENKYSFKLQNTNNKTEYTQSNNSQSNNSQSNNSQSNNSQNNNSQSNNSQSNNSQKINIVGYQYKRITYGRNSNINRKNGRGSIIVSLILEKEGINYQYIIYNYDLIISKLNDNNKLSFLNTLKKMNVNKIDNNNKKIKINVENLFISCVSKNSIINKYLSKGDEYSIPSILSIPSIGDNISNSLFSVQINENVYNSTPISFNNSISVSSIALLNSDKILCGSNKDIKLRNLNDGELIKIIDSNITHNSLGVIFGNEKKIVSGGMPSGIRILNIVGEKSFEEDRLNIKYNEISYSVAIIGNFEKIVSGNSDNTIIIFDMKKDCMRKIQEISKFMTWNPLKKKDCMKILIGHQRSVKSVAIIENGNKIVSGSNDKTIKIWNSESGECLDTLTGHTGAVTSIAIIQKSMIIVSGSDDKTIKLWNSITGICLHTLIGHSLGIRTLAIIPNSMIIVSGSDDKTIKVWDYIEETCLQTLIGHTDLVNCIIVNSDGNKIISGSSDGTIKIWTKYKK